MRDRLGPALRAAALLGTTVAANKIAVAVAWYIFPIADESGWLVLSTYLHSVHFRNLLVNLYETVTPRVDPRGNFTDKRSD